MCIRDSSNTDTSKMEVESYTYVSERILTLQFETCCNYLTVVGVYAPEEGWKVETEDSIKHYRNKFISGTEQTTSL